ncbi:hypothetical protein HHI36_020067 [Cryptolaemus montrouzieri]|uniref:Uncharacterized protein n=1 Tax=Cryptolaemus montrouzieri TaxID=559131 RepID=A0ABD2NA81_9CUCU
MNNIQDYTDFDNDFYDLSQDFEEYQDDQIDNEYFIDVFNYCGVLSVQSITPLLKKLILSNLIFGSVLSIEVGSSKGRIILTIYFFISYLIFLSNHYIGMKYQKRIGTLLKFSFIASLVLSEYLVEKKFSSK